MRKPEELHIYDSGLDEVERGEFTYTSVAETIRTWAQDPYGKKVFDFVSQTYGIPADKVRRVFADGGMGEYLAHKDQGRYIGMVSTQILRPSYYFMESAKIVADAAKRGIPTAFMVLEYPDDKFVAFNGDKKTAFGKIEFPVGIKEKTAKGGKVEKEIETVEIEIRPIGIRHDDGTIQRIRRIDEASGFRCDQIMIQIVDAKGPNKQPYTMVVDGVKREEVITDGKGKVIGSKTHKQKTTQTQYEAALGFTIPHLPKQRTTLDGVDVFNGIDREGITITEFYKILWSRTIDSMRKTGQLPSEDDMPMFFVDMKHFYSTLAKHADVPENVRTLLRFDSYKNLLIDVLELDASTAEALIAQGETAIVAYLNAHDLRIQNGLLVHTNGMMDSGSYYPLQVAAADVYPECSTHGDPKFINKLKRAQKVRKAAGFPETQVQIPHIYTPALEKYTVHPTGKIFTDKPEKDPREVELAQQIEAIHKTPGVDKREKQAASAHLYVEVKKLQGDAHARFIEKLMILDDKSYTPIGYIEPPDITDVHNQLVEGIDEAVIHPAVQHAIEQTRKAHTV